MRMLKVCRKRRRPGRALERGAQLVELAIVAPILLLLLAATVEFGNYFYTYTTLAKATRTAARYASSQSDLVSEIANAKSMAVCGCAGTCGSGGCASMSAVLPNLSSDNINITYTTLIDNPSYPDKITVQITGYTYTPIFDLGSLVGGSWADVNVSPSTTMRSTVVR